MTMDVKKLLICIALTYLSFTVAFQVFLVDMGVHVVFASMATLVFSGVFIPTGAFWIGGVVTGTGAKMKVCLLLMLQAFYNLTIVVRDLGSLGSLTYSILAILIALIGKATDWDDGKLHVVKAAVGCAFGALDTVRSDVCSGFCFLMVPAVAVLLFTLKVEGPIPRWVMVLVEDLYPPTVVDDDLETHVQDVIIHQRQHDEMSMTLGENILDFLGFFCSSLGQSVKFLCSIIREVVNEMVSLGCVVLSLISGGNAMARAALLIGLNVGLEGLVYTSVGFVGKSWYFAVVAGLIVLGKITDRRDRRFHIVKLVAMSNFKSFLKMLRLDFLSATYFFVIFMLAAAVYYWNWERRAQRQAEAEKDTSLPSELGPEYTEDDQERSTELHSEIEHSEGGQTTATDSHDTLPSETEQNISIELHSPTTATDSLLAEELQVGIEEAVRREALRSAFYDYDKDRKGFISAVELRHILTSIGRKLTDEEADHLIHEVDADGDGQITCDEFIKVLI